MLRKEDFIWDRRKSEGDLVFEFAKTETQIITKINDMHM